MIQRMIEWARRAACAGGRAVRRSLEALSLDWSDRPLEPFCAEWNPPKKGRWGERAAAQFLFQKGFRILERNRRHGGVEVDLLAADQDVLVFVEVKLCMASEGSVLFGRVDAAKMSRLRYAAQAYLRRLRPPWPPVRIDLVGVEVLDAAQAPSIQHIKGAAWVNQADQDRGRR